MNLSQEMLELGSKRSVIRELFEYGKRQAAIVGAENVYDYSIGKPTVPAPECVKEAILSLLETEPSDVLHGYTSAQGDLELRAGLAAYMNASYPCKLHADDFYITCGAAASLAITLKALTAAETDEFIVLAPYFPEYPVFIRNAGARTVVVPPDMGKFEIPFDLLAAALTPNTKGVIINSPNNPTGIVYPDAVLKELAELLRRKSAEFGTAIYLISDEPYREVVYDGITPAYIPAIYENTIVCYSYSKSLSLTGERIGYILVPSHVEEARAVYAAVCGAGRALGYVCAPSLFQKVVLKCLGETADISAYDYNRTLLYDALSEMGYDCVKPGGAFYLFVRALEADAVAFSEKAKAFNLLLVPADDFGCPGYVRISYCVQPDMIRRSLPAFRQLRELYSNEA
ncbi:pyridoxal phosphate-dependent aminotransferase [Paenibacillus sp. NFR01]|uniref:pyridoxal phosphate-dependent aminotransferase n=1 Tax=Paenibacillus sp. NFR01 TaxID=1566279 RepID=UPI0008B0151F|nr:pyridoxal phosphate-dependent aminotransferase [Paenibacillus sp. NFR01]SEU27872.1 aspartate aminotransferase [Paenibacillus sp. NFR01]